MNDTDKGLVKTGNSVAPTSVPWHPFDALRQATRERAYFIWEREGRPPGRDIANWLQAEAEIKQEHNDVGGFVRSWADVVAAGHRTQGCWTRSMAGCGIPRMVGRSRAIQGERSLVTAAARLA